MNIEQEARVHDQNDRPRDAIKAYEEAIGRKAGDLLLYLDAAVLYLECTDGGYLAEHALPDELIERAYVRSREILDAAERRFGNHNEIDFWCYYLDYFVLGREASARLCEEFATRGPSLVPYFHIFALPGGERYAPQARALWDQVSAGRTARERHILSILESHGNDSKWGNLRP